MSLGANVYQVLFRLGLYEWGGGFWSKGVITSPPYLVMGYALKSD